jgi:hypothetical protein
MYIREAPDLNWLKEVFTYPVGYESLVDLQGDFVTGRDASDPTTVDQGSLITNGLAYSVEGAAEKLDTESLLLLKQATFSDDLSVPRPELWAFSALRVNRLLSFLGRDRLEDISNLLGPELAAEFDPKWRSDILTQAFQSIESEPDHFFGWLTVAAVFVDLPAPEEIGNQIEACLAKLNFVALAEQARAGVKANLLRLVIGRIAHVREASARKHITLEIIRLAGWYGSDRGTDEEVSLLVSLILAHSYPITSKGASQADFEQLCLAVADTCRKAARALRAVIELLCTDLPIDQSASFWPLLTRLRTLA